MKATFFKTPALFRTWLERNHGRATELLVGFYRKDSGIPSMTWPESVDEALCFGWIDGVRKRIDEKSYTIRFTPRKQSSNWSAVNIGRVTELVKLGRIQPAGLRAFEQRREDKSRIYAYENKPKALPPDDEKKFRARRGAWEFFAAQAPSYRRLAVYWVLSAKKKETRDRRLQTLIDDSAQGRRLGTFTLTPKKK